MGTENSGEGVIHNGVPWGGGHRAPGCEGVVRAATGKEVTKKKKNSSSSRTCGVGKGVPTGRIQRPCFLKSKVGPQRFPCHL